MPPVHLRNATFDSCKLTATSLTDGFSPVYNAQLYRIPRDNFA